MIVRISTPDIPVDGAQVVRFTIADDAGTALVPTSVSVSIGDADGVIISAGTAAVDLDGGCTYPAAPALPLGWGYIVRVSAVVDGAAATPAPGVIDVVPMILSPEITDADLLTYEPMLSQYAPAGATGYSGVRAAAWEQIRIEVRQRAMADEGRGYGYPADAGQLRLPHLYTALSLAIAPLSTDPSDVWAGRAEKYRERSREALARVQMRYRTGGDGSGWSVVGVG